MCGPPSQPNQVWENTGELYSTDLTVIIPNNISLSNHFLYHDHCENIVVQARNTSHLLVSNGSLYVPQTGFIDNFCIDNGVMSDGEPLEIVIQCYQNNKGETNHLRGDVTSCIQMYGRTFRLVNSISCSISLVFLFITALVYLFVPDLNNLHGRIILSNVLSIFCLTIYLLIIYNQEHIFSDILCILLGYFGYFSTMSMFSWMTIMSFDLCWMFRQPKARVYYSF